MTERSIAHGSFTIERTYTVPPARVFRAWADPKVKVRWFGPSEIFDFREGGHEFAVGPTPDGSQTFTLDVRYYDVVPDNRIVYAYEMTLDGERISVSVVTVEFRAENGGTQMVVTEHGAYLDGFDTIEDRRRGTEEILDVMGRVVEAEG